MQIPEDEALPGLGYHSKAQKPRCLLDEPGGKGPPSPQGLFTVTKQLAEGTWGWLKNYRVAYNCKTMISW